MPGRRLTDYGGNNAGKKSVNTRAVTPENCFSMRCISCEKLHYVSKAEIVRVNRPRCAKCGGGLTEIESHYYKRIGTTPAQLQRKKKTEDAQKPFKCRHCPAAFRNDAALILHVKEKHGAANDPRHTVGADNR